MKKSTTIMSGIAGLVLLIISSVNYFAMEYLDTPTLLILLVGALLSIIYAVYNIQDIKGLFSRRTTQYIGNAFIASLLGIGIVVMINFIFNRHNVRLDLTESKQFTLAEQTIKILENLDKEVTITAFFQSGDKMFVQDMITEYQQYSGKLKFKFFDPDKSREIANNYGIKSYGTVVFETEGRSEKIYYLDDQSLTNALIKVTREEKKKIYFTTGHGERGIDDFEPGGLSVLKDQIVDLNYEVNTINLAREKSIPGDCSVLVVNGPQSELFSAELDAIDVFINNGGKVFFLLDPGPDTGMIEYFDKWGIRVGDDMVVDFSGRGKPAGYPESVPLVTDYNPEHPIVANFNLTTFFVMTRSVTPKKGALPEGVVVDWLAKTTPQSWGEVDYRGDPDKPGEKVNIEPNEEKDLRGPVSIAAIAEKSTGNFTALGNPRRIGILVVFGDSDFTSNIRSGSFGNGPLFLNVLNWLAGEEDLVAVPPKDAEDRRIQMTVQQAKFTLYLTVYILPSIILFIGLSVFFRRRGM